MKGMSFERLKGFMVLFCKEWIKMQKVKRMANFMILQSRKFFIFFYCQKFYYVKIV